MSNCHGECYRRAMAKQMQDRTLCRILDVAVERRFGNGASDKWKRILHAVAVGASLQTILKGKFHG